MRRMRNEEGFAVVAAIVILAVIMGLGLGLLQFADAQQKASTREQASEAAFNVAEAALNAQVGQLDRKWPFKEPRTTAEAEAEMPSVCTSAETYNASTDCPSPTDLERDPNTGSTTCSGTDRWGSPLSNRWTTYVREDPGGSPLFNSTAEESLPAYASSDAGALWVRAVGVVQCHPVAVVTLVTRQRIKLKLPPDAIAGNWFEVTNKGNKDIVSRESETSGEPGPVSMRCESPPPAGCEVYEPLKEQVSPPITPNEPKSPSMTLTPTELATLKAEAQAYGKFYYPTAPYHCPTGTNMEELEGVRLPAGTRAPVYIEGCGAVKIKATRMANCEPPTPVAPTPKPESPGFLVLANGTLELSGNSTYCGVIYAANLENLKTAVVRLQGGTVVVGGIIVDGPGGIQFGSSGQGGNPANLVFDPLAFDQRDISAGAASTRNSFRILPSGQ
jgi:type II secretory pathway pseudopilin PulG